MAKNQFKLNGYDLSLKMRKSRRKFALNATDQALFNELVAICNEDGWERYFKCSNWELCNALRISENTLVKSRKQLIKADLIYFKSGKSKREYSTYSFLTTSKFEVDAEVVNPTTPLTPEQFTSNNEVKAADYYKGKEETKQINIYSEKDFLKDWNELRAKHLKKPSRLNNIGGGVERASFNDLLESYSRKDFKNALIGLFKQKSWPNDNSQMASNPKHFLTHFNTYLTAFHDQNAELYGKQKTESIAL
ncbi:hypothetical protein SAMN05444483_10994 [Salegentibacter echinorum]|uniref:Uncharacterized protein n=1 Tax=Salegentibacter echinorum TaxID=1073325 RepID=A0A1M5J3L0_SALEC|nr:hypothetical protein [Salegentibacter echinorum]SHG34945.1 hypothetical protein SAMN05444483_10994 [Salegentibacter echinorum]